LKKWVVLLSLIILATVTYTAWSESVESEYYVKTVPIFKIYHHNEGFRVVYETQSLELKDTFIPYSWFKNPQLPEEGSWKAEVVYGDVPDYPYFNVYWKNGQFSHIRLFLRNKRTHPSWGTLKDPNRYDDSFNIEAPVLEF